jgi:hypothetical protein
VHHIGLRRKTHYVLTTNGTPSGLGGQCLRITQVADIAGSIEALSTCFHGDAGPVIRPKWRRRQSILIKQIATWAVAPSIADRHWHRHIGTGYYDRDSIDRCCDIGPGESEERLCVMILMPGLKRSVHFSSTMRLHVVGVGLGCGLRILRRAMKRVLRRCRFQQSFCAIDDGRAHAECSKVHSDDYRHQQAP